MSDSARRISNTHGFQLSPNMFEPSNLIQGPLGNMLRRQNYVGSQRALHHEPRPQDNAFALMHPRGNFFSNFFESRDPFDSMMHSFMGHGFMRNHLNPLDEMYDSIPGTYQSNVSVMSSYIDQDGNRQTERYGKAARGDYRENMHEVKEAYSDSHSQKDVVAMERRVRDRGIQVVRNRDNQQQMVDEVTNAINMDQSEIDNFNRQWSERFQRVFTPTLSHEQQHRPAIEDRREQPRHGSR